MPSAACRLCRIVWGVLRTGLLAAVASCSKTTVAGVVLKFDTDGTLDPDTLHVTITAKGQTPLDWCYPITSPATFFPTTLAIDPNGEPTETVAVTASVLRAGETLDVRDYLVEVPNDRVLQSEILFSATCSAQVSGVVGPPHGANCRFGVAASFCSPGNACRPTTGMCAADDADAMSVDGSVPEGGADVGAPANPPSCAPAGLGMTTCGAGGSGNESCCTSLEVPGGTFDRTYMSDADGGATGETSPATISTFRLDKYDVTVGRFRQFVTAWDNGFRPGAGSGKHAHLNGGQGLVNVGADGGFEPGWLASDDSNLMPTKAPCGSERTWTNTPGTQESLPINCVNWYEAYAFCIWDGAFLPTDAELGYATAGGSEQREYPWGNADPGALNQFAIYDCHYGPASCDSVDSIAPVGTPALGTGRWGQKDLVGNVWQWTLDYATDLPYGVPCFDCAFLTTTSQRVVRGGDFDSDPFTLSPAIPDSDPPTDREGIFGFRCARAP